MPAKTWLAVTIQCVIAVSCTAWPQVQQQHRTVVVNGQSGDTTVIQFNGQTYVDLESLVQTANGSASFEGDRIILILPSSRDHGSQTNDTQDKLSRDFMKAGIEEISLLREWATPLATAVQNGYPIAEEWVRPYEHKAEDGLRTASASMSSDADRNAFQLLTNEFEAVRQWSTQLLAARKSMSAANYAISDDALRNDPLSKKIIACAHFLGSMLASGAFQDDASCH